MVLRSADSSEVLRVNPPFTQRLGLTAADLAARPLLEWIHPNDGESLARALDAGNGCAKARRRVFPGSAGTFAAHAVW